MDSKDQRREASIFDSGHRDFFLSAVRSGSDSSYQEPRTGTKSGSSFQDSRGGEGNHEVGSVVKCADGQDTLDALLQPGQPQDGGKPALYRSQLFYVAVAPVLRVLALQVRQEVFITSSSAKP